MALEARHASKCHPGSTPGPFRGEAGLSEQFKGGGGVLKGWRADWQVWMKNPILSFLKRSKVGQTHSLLALSRS